MGTRNPKPRQSQPGMDLKSFKAWVACAEPKQVCVYFEGRHLADCANQDTAEAAREAFAKGQIELLQRRLPEGPLEYLAIKRKEVRIPMVGGDKWKPQLTNKDLLLYAPKWVHA